MTLRQIDDEQPAAKPLNRAFFIDRTLDKYHREARRKKVHPEHRMIVAWSVVQVLRDLRHLCDEINADFSSLSIEAEGMYRAEAAVGGGHHVPGPLITASPKPMNPITSLASVPKPSEAYQAKQKEFVQIHQSPAKKDYRLATKLQSDMQKEFMTAFGLSDDRGNVAKKLFGRFDRQRLGPRSEIFDHETFFRRGNNAVIVSQPYGIEAKELMRWAADVGATVTIANEWGFYFPGEAALFFVEFTPEAKDALDARIRALD